MLPQLLALLVLSQSPGRPLQQSEVRDAISRAEALYYQAKFQESIITLVSVHDSIGAAPELKQERIEIDLRLALSHIGLNDPAKAKSYLAELFQIDPAYALSADQFPPKVISLANEVKSERRKSKCDTAVNDARAQIKAGSLKEASETLQAKNDCPALAAIEAELADGVYRAGLDAYKQGDLAKALENFHAALKLAPKHELATQYSELAESKLQVAEDRELLEWRRNFEARKLPQAAANYRQLTTFNKDTRSPAMEQAKSEYLKSLTGLVDEWNQACPAADPAVLGRIRERISELIPEPTFGADIQSGMKTCSRPTPPPAIVASVPAATPKAVVAAARPAAAETGCVQTPGTAALARVKSRVDPIVPPDVRGYIQNQPLTVLVKARIDEKGNVTQAKAEGTNIRLNSAVETAIANWKFVPSAGQNGPRCVDTEISLTFGSGAAAQR